MFLQQQTESDCDLNILGTKPWCSCEHTWAPQDTRISTVWATQESSLPEAQIKHILNSSVQNTVFVALGVQFTTENSEKTSIKDIYLSKSRCCVMATCLTPLPPASDQDQLWMIKQMGAADWLIGMWWSMSCWHAELLINHETEESLVNRPWCVF